MKKELGIQTDKAEATRFLISLGLDKMSYKEFLEFLMPNKRIKFQKKLSVLALHEREKQKSSD